MIYFNKTSETFQLGNAYDDTTSLDIFNGGINIEEYLIFSSFTINAVPSSPVTSSGNQIFIIFSTDNNGLDKKFSAKITFGMPKSLNHQIHYLTIFLHML